MSYKLNPDKNLIPRQSGIYKSLLKIEGPKWRAPLIPYLLTGLIKWAEETARLKTDRWTLAPNTLGAIWNDCQSKKMGIFQYSSSLIKSTQGLHMRLSKNIYRYPCQWRINSCKWPTLIYHSFDQQGDCAHSPFCCLSIILYTHIQGGQLFWQAWKATTHTRFET